MDSSLIAAIWLHGIERIVAVLLGGIAVYYGFRLFLVLPVQTQSDGKIRLPGMSVVLAKAGPGLFFAAFGAIVIAMSLNEPLQLDYRDGNIRYRGMVGPQSDAVEKTSPSAPQEVERVRLALQSLNCMYKLATKKPNKLPADDLEVAVRDAKLALLRGVWNPNKWGEFEPFTRWATGEIAATVSPARSLFEAHRTDCPG